MSDLTSRKLKMRRLTEAEIGHFGLDMMSLLHGSPDPYASLIYLIDIGPIRRLLTGIRTGSGEGVTLTHILNKILALAISENPIFNQVMLSNHIYQIEGVHIANAFLVPGENQGITYITLDDPHLKSLETIRDESRILMEKRVQEFSTPPNPISAKVMRFFYRYQILKILGEKRLFRIAFERGLLSNIVFLNQVYGKAASFIVVKPVITNIKVSLRIHAHGPVQQTLLENDQLVHKDIIPFNISIDHRVLHGIHAHNFGESLRKIAASPESFLI